MSTAVVHRDQWLLQVYVLNPIWRAELHAEMADSIAIAERVARGEITREEAYGLALTAEELRLDIYNRWPSMRAKYPLPEHLHWMGDGEHDTPWRQRRPTAGPVRGTEP